MRWKTTHVPKKQLFGWAWLSCPMWSTHQQLSNCAIFTSQEDVVSRGSFTFSHPGQQWQCHTFPRPAPQDISLNVTEGGLRACSALCQKGGNPGLKQSVELCSLKKQILNICWSQILLLFWSMTLSGALLDPCGGSSAWGELLVSVCLQRPPPSSLS